MKQPKPLLTSIRLPRNLYEQIELKSVELGGMGVSETIRFLLNWSLEHSQSDFLRLLKENTQTAIHEKVQEKMLQHLVTIYYLLKGHIVNPEENGLTLNNTAHEKAKEAMKKILAQ